MMPPHLSLPWKPIIVSHIFRGRRMTRISATYIMTRRQVWLLRKAFISPLFTLPSQKRLLQWLERGKGILVVSKLGGVSFYSSEM